MAPIPYGKQAASGEELSYGQYELYRQQLQEKYNQDPKFAAAFRKTSSRLVDSKKEVILAQGKRIRSASPKLSHFTDEQLHQLAIVCSLNYLLEECPVLFARLSDQKYTSILYPGALEVAFIEVQKFFSDKPIFWLNVHHEEVKPTIEKIGDSRRVDESARPMTSATAAQSLLAYRKRSWSGNLFITPHNGIPHHLSVPASSNDVSSPQSDPLPGWILSNKDLSPIRPSQIESKETEMKAEVPHSALRPS